MLGLPGAGLIFLLEGLGAPIPIEIPLWIIGRYQTGDWRTYWQMVFLMWSCTVVGNLVGYAVGYYGGRPVILKLMAWFRVRPEFWNRVEGWFQKHGLKAVLVTRWINWGFAQNMWLCGITRVPFRRFFTVMTINNFLWAMAWTWIAHKAVRYIGRAVDQFTARAGVAILVLGLAGLAVWGLVRWVRKRREPTG